MTSVFPLPEEESHRVLSHMVGNMDIPVHEHVEMELSLILKADGARYIIGNRICEMGGMELLFIGPHLQHGWLNPSGDLSSVRMVSVHFHKGLFPDGLLEKNQAFHLRQLLENAKRGICFSNAVASRVAPRMLALEELTGFESLHELYSLLHQLSMAGDSRMLSDITFTGDSYRYKSRRLERVFRYLNTQYARDITLDEVAGIANMPPASFCRFIKTHTGRTFLDNLLEIRMGHVSRLLVESALPIADIAYACGFNNLANFNRIFKSRNGLTPREFKREVTGSGSERGRGAA